MFVIVRAYSDYCSVSNLNAFINCRQMDSSVLNVEPTLNCLLVLRIGNGSKSFPAAKK
jgi:hypothetical protein